MYNYDTNTPAVELLVLEEGNRELEVILVTYAVTDGKILSTI